MTKSFRIKNDYIGRRKLEIGRNISNESRTDHKVYCNNGLKSLPNYSARNLSNKQTLPKLQPSTSKVKLHDMWAGL